MIIKFDVVVWIRFVSDHVHLNETHDCSKEYS